MKEGRAEDEAGGDGRLGGWLLFNKDRRVFRGCACVPGRARLHRCSFQVGDRGASWPGTLHGRALPAAHHWLNLSGTGTATEKQPTTAHFLIAVGFFAKSQPTLSPPSPLPWSSLVRLVADGTWHRHLTACKPRLCLPTVLLDGRRPLRWQVNLCKYTRNRRLS